MPLEQWFEQISVKCGHERSHVAQVDHADRRNLYLPWNPVAKERPPRVRRREHQNLLSKRMGREREWGVISGYILAVRAAETTTNVSRYSRGIELQLARSRRLLPRGHAKYARSSFDNLIPPMR